MNRNSGGSTIDRNGASDPTKAERAEKAGKPSPDRRARDETSDDGPAAIDLDTARDRAS